MVNKIDITQWTCKHLVFPHSWSIVQCDWFVYEWTRHIQTHHCFLQILPQYMREPFNKNVIMVIVVNIKHMRTKYVGHAHGEKTNDDADYRKQPQIIQVVATIRTTRQICNPFSTTLVGRILPSSNKEHY